jgi:hypothetical protein
LTVLNVFGFQKFRINNRPSGSWKIWEKIWFRSHQIDETRDVNNVLFQSQKNDPIHQVRKRP